MINVETSNGKLQISNIITIKTIEDNDLAVQAINLGISRDQTYKRVEKRNLKDGKINVRAITWYRIKGENVLPVKLGTSMCLEEMWEITLENNKNNGK